MDPKRNPFAPGAGYTPPELAGRKDILDRFDILLSRLKSGKPFKGLLLVGLRGVGKTVLLNKFYDQAAGLGLEAFSIECIDKKRLDQMLVPYLRSSLFRLDKREGLNETVRKAFRVLHSFASKISVKYGEFEFDLAGPKEEGVADSGDLETDLPELVMAVAEAAKSKNTAVLIILDEMQYLAAPELSALIMAVHKAAQRQMPVALVGAGLPPLLGKMGNSKSYAERLFDYPRVGPLDREGVVQAVQMPVEASKAFVERRAVDHIFNVTKGYPYFVQEWGHHAWNCAKGSNIELRAAQNADSAARKSLDESFFSVRFDRLTPGEKEYLRSMAYFGGESVKSSKIAEALGQSPQSANTLRSSLIKKGMIYSPSYGDAAFTVPLFDQFMRRKIPDWSPKG